MDDASAGFRIGERLLPWGSTVADARAGGKPPVEGDGGALHFEMPRCYGFDVLYAQLAGGDDDHPVMSVTYELAAPRGRIPGAAVHFFHALRERLGPPAEESREDMVGRGNPADGVALWARWSRPPVTIGISVYGAPRKQHNGYSGAMLYLSWEDTATAAARFVPEWRAACGRLAQSAASVGSFTCYSVDWPLFAVSGGYDEDPARPERADRLALSYRNVLLTPSAIADRLSNTTFALWRSGTDGAWALSTMWDTVLLGDGGERSVDYLVAQPARGGGWSEISATPWAARSSHDSADMAAAADAIAKLPGVTLNRHSGADY